MKEAEKLLQEIMHGGASVLEDHQGGHLSGRCVEGKCLEIIL